MKNTRSLIEFINEGTDSFHAAAAVKKRLSENGFEELYERDAWKLKHGGKYYVLRNSSSIIAFTVPQGTYRAFLITASHTDSPCFKLKGNFEERSAETVRLNVEGYGGMIMASWLDRPLSVSGRVVFEENGRMVTRLVNIDRDLVIIPSLAIHLNRDANKGCEYSLKTDMCPIAGSKNGYVMDLTAEDAGVKKEDILGFDLFLYNRMKGTVTGPEDEYVCAPRIDDLQCVFASLEGLLQAGETDTVHVLAAFDNEEVGSGTKQGAKSTFLSDTLERISSALGGDAEKYKTALSQSFMLSCDNAHAVHPNHSEKSDAGNSVYMNGGIVIKYNANQRYTTDAVSEAAVKSLCKKARVPYQLYANRSDMPGGSTLGNLSAERVSINTADIGLAQLAMHSAYETAGARDTTYMIKLVKEFYESEIEF